MTFAEIPTELKVIILRSGKKNKEVAKSANMSAGKLSKILNGSQTPTEEEISAISKTCGYEYWVDHRFTQTHEN